MQFLSDVFIRCPQCNGRRYREHILEVRVQSAEGNQNQNRNKGGLSIADVLESTVDEALVFLESLSDSKPARKASDALRLLQEVGLGYLQLGQPINTLSGGESQRLKLVRHLADSAAALQPSQFGPRTSNFELRTSNPTLFLLDEPTTGLHFEDVRILLKALQRLVDAGHSLVVIEHNLDVLKCADWIIDLGPEAGDAGGRLVVAGTPEQVADCRASHTGRFLREALRTPARPRPTRHRTPGTGSRRRRS
jgi:excinuclease ABC subunit A